MATSPNPTPKSRGLPVWTLMVAMLIGAAVLIGLLVTLLVTTRSRLASVESDAERLKEEMLRNEIQVTKLKADESRSLAQQQRELLLTHAATATNALEQLLVELGQTEESAAGLLSGDDGRLVAAHADLVPQARRFYEVILPALSSSSQVVTKLEAVRRIQQGLLDASGSDFVPRNEATVEVQNAAVWAQQELRRVSDAQTFLRSLVQESKIKVGGAEVTATSPTLEAAIASLKEAESSQFQRAVQAKTQEAEAERRERLSEIEAEKIRENMQAEIQSMLAKARAESERIIAEGKIQADRMTRDAQESLRQAKIEDMRREAAGIAQETQETVKTQQSLHETDKVRLRAKASSAEVQGALSPFITPGLWKIGGGVTYEMRPHSWTALKNSGALDPSVKGLSELAMIGRTSKDKVRPRWDMGTRFFNDPIKSQRVREAQQLLIELGEVMVEMGMLDE